MQEPRRDFDPREEVETNGFRRYTASPQSSQKDRPAANIQAGSGKGSERLYKTWARPVSEYAVGFHGVSPSEMEGRRLAVRALSPTSKGVSRTAKPAYHQEPVADAQLACTAQLLR